MRWILVFLLFFTFNSNGQDVNIEIVFFDFNSDFLKPSEKIKIDNLLSTPRISIDEVIAYCDPIGSDASNMDLAKLRNGSVFRYIESKGFSVKKQTEQGNKGLEVVPKEQYSQFRKVVIRYSIPVSIPVEKVNTYVDQFNNINLDSLGSSTKPTVLNIQFAPGLDQLIGNSELEIQNLYDFLRANENVSAFIRGHVCCTHDPTLSTARAYVVYKKLVDHGISPLRLKYEGFSNTIPAISPEVIEEHRQANRRVDVIFSKIN